MKISSESIDGMKMGYVDVAPLAMINTDLEINDQFPPAVEAFRLQILEADGIFFASPEYNYSIARKYFASLHFQSFLQNLVLWLLFDGF